MVKTLHSQCRGSESDPCLGNEDPACCTEQTKKKKKKKKNTRFSLEAELVKSPPAMQETLVQFLGQADPLEKA